MRVSLINKKQIKNIVLPEKIEGSYWITDYDMNNVERNLVSIEANNNEWLLKSNREVQYRANQIFYPSTPLQNYQFYNLYHMTEKRNYLIYCSPFLENYNYYDINSLLDNGITIGQNGFIEYSVINVVAGYIRKENEKIYVFDNNFGYGIFVNNVRIINKQEIKIGDVIFIMGLKMILTKKDNNYYLAINNPASKVSVKAMPIGNLASKNPYEEDQEEFEIPLYTDNDYFHKMPRFVSVIKPLVLSVDAPPAKVDDSNNSMLLTLGPMLTMSMTSLVTGYTAINNVLAGKSDWNSAAPSLVMCGAMFSSVFLWPLISKKIEKRRIKEQERKRQKKYGEYIEEKRKKIQEGIIEQKNILNSNYPNIKECESIILEKYTSLWQKRIDDDDFLNLSLGYGNSPMNIDIKYPEDHFSMAEDNLKEMVSKLGNEPKILSNVPIVYSFYQNFISSVIGESTGANEYIKRLLIQLIAFHSYKDLKIVIFTDTENEYEWEFVKTLPHCFSDDHKLRFFATNNDEYKEVCYYLEQKFKEREQIKNGDPKKEDIGTFYFIITDKFKNIRGFDVIESILENKTNLGFSILISSDKVTNLPDQCKSFIQINNEMGELHNNISNHEILKFNIDFITPVDYDLCAKTLANIPIKIESNDDGSLPSKLGFLEMYDVGKIEQLNSFIRWQKNNPIINLQVPVGVGKNGEKISIDLHEKYHGPHGLIAGMTGSGKSEFIITYILSMAINYHPDEVQFILIDYKGGGLAGAFENKNTGIKLPHLVGTITNLDANEIKRSLSSIESELKRRQSLFNIAREKTEEGTIDIYKYQKMYREGIVTEPVSHLFIISDEFAELKNQQPEFMEQLISTARIGRSLGVHLILATQKPSGVVDPQIWSNTRFRVCLRVQEKSDSTEVIKCPDAAYLKQTGRFYFQVGYNEIFVLGQAAWAGGKYYPAERVNKTIDTSINIIDHIGYTIKNVETKEKVQNVASNGEELLNIVKYLNNLAESHHIKTRPLWLEKIPSEILVDQLSQKYSYQKDKFILNPIIGEYDVPSRQEQNLLTINFSNGGNVLVYGASGSGKENLINTVIYSSMRFYTPDEVNYYLVDFGTESLKNLSASSIVGDILLSDDEEKIGNLYKMIYQEIDQRKILFTDYNGDYINYCKNSGKTIPNIVVIINNYESYQETYPEFDDDLTVLTRECARYGIYFLITVSTPNGIRFKLKQNFSNILVLQQNNEDDYTTILGNVHKTYPSKIFGRGILKLDDIFEFQTAYACPKDNLTEYMKHYCLEYSSQFQNKARPVPVLPKEVNYNQLVLQYNENGMILGLNKKTLQPCTFDFRKNFLTTVMSLDITSTQSFINNLIKEMVVKQTSLFVINTEDYIIDSENRDLYQYTDSKINEAFCSLYNFIKEQHKIYEENNFDKKIFASKSPINCIIIGIDSFKGKLSDENKLNFSNFFNDAKELGIVNFILVDSIDRFKKLELEPWYKNCCNNTNGIWVGNGINDQFVLKISQKIEEMKEDISNEFGFVVERGKPAFIKFINRVDVEREEEFIDVD